MIGFLARRCWVGLLALSACAQEEHPAPLVARTDTVAIERDRCIVPAHTRDDPRLIAARCAALFVVRNGYTDVPPVPDSSQWVWEFMDLNIEHRRNSLEPQPVRSCTAHDGFAVLFRYRDPEAGGTVRSLELTSAFSGLRFQHQAMLLAPLPSNSSCVELASQGRSR